MPLLNKQLLSVIIRRRIELWLGKKKYSFTLLHEVHGELITLLLLRLYRLFLDLMHLKSDPAQRWNLGTVQHCVLIIHSWNSSLIITPHSHAQFIKAYVLLWNCPFFTLLKQISLHISSHFVHLINTLCTSVNSTATRNPAESCNSSITVNHQQLNIEQLNSKILNIL